MIDLRSDTVTLPSPEMRLCIYQAELGDDLFKEDPTVNRLEELAAEVTGKEEALLTSSGTMSNLLSHMTHCQPGDEVVVGQNHHTVLYEVGGAASIAGVLFRTLGLDESGCYDLGQLERAIRTRDLWEPPTALIWTENTFADGGGAVVPTADLQKMSAVARQHSVPIHLDGARVFNAATYLGVQVSEITTYADTVSFCLTKGLAAPVGSMLCGPGDFVSEARRNRQKLGGGLRQAGIIAAAGIYAIEKMSERLQEDHDNARLLAQGLAAIPALALDADAVQTNIVVCEITSKTLSPVDFIQYLGEEGVLALLLLGGRPRFVTHYGIERRDIEAAVKTIARVMKEHG